MNVSVNLYKPIRTFKIKGGNKMKRKLALLIAAVMTVAMVPATAFASTKLTAVDEIKVGTDKEFTSRVELSKSNDQVDIDETKYPTFDVYATLTNGKFAKDDDDNYKMDAKSFLSDTLGVKGVEVISDTKAKITLNTTVFNGNFTKENGKDRDVDACVLPLIVKSGEVGDVVVKFTSNVTAFKTASEVIATAQTGKVEITSEGVRTFVEDATKDEDIVKDITIKELTPDVLKGGSIKLKLSGNWKFTNAGTVSFLNEDGDEKVDATAAIDPKNDDTIIITFKDYNEGKKDADPDYRFAPNMLTDMTISGIKIQTLKKCKAGDVATITVSSLASSKEFSNVKLEVAKMVKEAVTYSVEDKDLPVIWAGEDNDDDNTLKVSVEENTGDILNTSRKATFTFPEGIEVAKATFEGTKNSDFECEIDENVVTIKNYSKNDKESEKTDFDVNFVLNAAPTFSGDVNVTLGGQFDDVTLKVATVKAPYTVTAKTSEVLIDYRYVPVNDIVITEAEEGILKEDDQIVLGVEKMDFEDAGKVEVTEGDIDVDVDIDDSGDWNLFDYKGEKAYLTVTVNDESTEASTIVISGLELYLDRTLPVGGYALENIGGYTTKTVEEDGVKKTVADKGINILWNNSSMDKKQYDHDAVTGDKGDTTVGYPAYFKYKAVTVNDSYVDVITSARDQDDSTTNKKIIITVGASTMAVGTETVNLDAPAYINRENYTMLPVRAITEAFGATVNWDAASRTVTVLSGQRIISMTIGSRTMYINGTPVAMNTTAAIVNDRTFIPVRDLANSLGISAIKWTEASGTVTLN